MPALWGANKELSSPGGTKFSVASNSNSGLCSYISKQTHALCLLWRF